MRVVIAGYYGYRNWGDEGSLAALLQGVPHEATTVLSGDPVFTQQTYGVRAVPRMALRAVRQAIRESDALILGGGSLLQDATSLRSLLYYLALIRWGLSAHGRVLLVGQGIGPLYRPLSRWLTGAMLRKVPFLSVRDADSAQRLRSLGVEQAQVDADLTWVLEAQPMPIGFNADARWVGVAPRPWRDAPVAEVMVAFCRQLHAEGFRTMLIPMQESQDRPLCEAIAAASKAFVLPAPTHPAQLLSVTRSLWGVVAMRLHGAIFAASQGTPVLCVSYDPKVDALATQLQAPRVGLEAISVDLPHVWRAFVAQRDALKVQTEQRVLPLRNAAEALLQRVKAALSQAG
ncbi:MAG: polysaccharide pyruvyl transferase CsaB [Fimbriimonadales bacterium]|nr:MAG: polysaccharide pyruvyl transferase CsaB [Fimbriimonadales bacterium]